MAMAGEALEQHLRRDGLVVANERCAQQSKLPAAPRRNADQRSDEIASTGPSPPVVVGYEHHDSRFVLLVM
ncbi:MAG: hypothetical protein ACRDTJ_09150 [Pseudonocardiaceae bacterium]